MAERELLDEREVEMRYNIKRSTQRAWRAQRRIPYIKLGGRLVRLQRRASSASDVFAEVVYGEVG